MNCFIFFFSLILLHLSLEGSAASYPILLCIRVASVLLRIPRLLTTVYLPFKIFSGFTNLLTCYYFFEVCPFNVLSFYPYYLSLLDYSLILTNILACLLNFSPLLSSYLILFLWRPLVFTRMTAQFFCIIFAAFFGLAFSASCSNYNDDVANPYWYVSWAGVSHHGDLILPQGGGRQLLQLCC